VSRVNVDFIAFSDPRFVRFAQLMGYADGDHARGKCELLWLECTRRGTSDLPQWVVESILGESAPPALIESELARWGRGRGDSKARPMYICGATKRCLWKSKKEEQTSKAGKARAVSAQRDAGRFLPATAGDAPPANSSAPSSFLLPPSSGDPDLPTGTDVPASGSAEDRLAEVKRKTEQAMQAKIARIHPRAWGAADFFRDLVLAENPNAALGKRPWSENSHPRVEWAYSLHRLVKQDGRSWEEIHDTLLWLFRSQSGSHRFVVLSPDSLREKWDRIAAVRRRPTAARDEIRDIERIA
jgi:hypothetical protein